MNTQFLVKAKEHTPLMIKCSVADRLLSNIPVPVVFIYKQAIPINKLVEALSRVLIDFPVFSGIFLIMVSSALSIFYVLYFQDSKMDNN